MGQGRWGIFNLHLGQLQIAGHQRGPASSWTILGGALVAAVLSTTSTRSVDGMLPARQQSWEEEVGHTQTYKRATFVTFCWEVSYRRGESNGNGHGNMRHNPVGRSQLRDGVAEVGVNEVDPKRAHTRGEAAVGAPLRDLLGAGSAWSSGELIQNEPKQREHRS